MAKEPTVSSKTPEQIAAMEEEVRLYRQQEAQTRADADREAAKPLVDLVESEAFAKVKAALPALDQLATSTLPALRVHFDALSHGIAGMEIVAGSFVSIPVSPAPDASA